jgi:Tol biopolymer transport system component
MRTARLATAILLALAAAPAAAVTLFGRLEPPAPATEANGPSTTAEVSGDGRVFVFESGATNWAPGAITGGKIIAVDFGADRIDVLSTTSTGVAFNGNAFAPSTAGSGRFVAFETFANNLGLTDNLGNPLPTSGSQIVRKDRTTGALALASANSSGTPVSGSASGQARNASISADGRFVSFRSDSTNLAGAPAGVECLYVKDLQTGAIELISRTLAGTCPSAGVVANTAHSMSADGRFVLFQSNGADLVAGVAGGTIQVYLRDRVAGSTELISAGVGGAPANSQSDIAAISPDGRFVSFRSFATNLGGSGFISRVYVRDRAAGTTSPVPLPVVNGTTATGCRESDVSNAGTVVMACFFTGVFDQVFLHLPGVAGTPFLVSSDAADAPGNQVSGGVVAINANGGALAFESRASNLVAGDTNAVSDIFILAEDAILDGLFADGFE